MPWLINATQLDKFRKSQKSLIILDASWHMPDSKRDAKAEFLDKHILGAQFLDLTAFNDPSPEAPHARMLSRDMKAVGEKLGALGIKNDFKIILYDNSSLHTACRALWMLKVFGHNPQLLYILDGGLNAWEKYGGKNESGESTVTAKQYTATWQRTWVRDLADMKANMQMPTEQVVDTRHAVRYAGAPEIRVDSRTGHMPGSFCFPSTTMFDINGAWRPLEKIRQQITGISVDLTRPIITSCGSGMTAPVLNFALDLLGQSDNAVYNGSWAEWGTNKVLAGENSVEERPVITSLDKGGCA